MIAGGKRIWTLFALSWLLFASSSHAVLVGPIAPELISGQRDASNGFGWDYSYDIELINHVIQVHTELSFTTGAGVTPAVLDALKPEWEQGIEDFWSNKYAVLEDGSVLFPIVFDVTFDGPVFNYTVNVTQGRTTSMLTWGTTPAPGESNGLLAAHEYGHMFGLFDEYVGGATDPTGAIIDGGSIMGSTAFGVEPRLRHYQDFAAWLAAKDPNDQFVIVQVPEPAAAWLLSGGMLGFIVMWRRRS
jgi:hypothetical protein